MRAILWKIVAVVASALLFVLALPPADIAPLGFFCFTPIFVTFRGKGFAWGFVAGMAVLVLAAFVSWQGWFYEKSLVDASPGWNFTGFALFGVVVGLTCAIIGEIKDPPRWLPWVLAAWVVLFEAVLLVYIPAHIALTQYRMFAAMKLASFGGIWLVSYLVWLVNLFLAEGYVQRHRWTMALCGGFLGAWFGFSAFTGHPRVGVLSVGIVQTETMVPEELAELNWQASELGAEIVVWPELAGMAVSPGGDTRVLQEIAAEPGQAPFVTSFNDDHKPLPYNVAAVFSDQGEGERYRKRKLFGAERNLHQRGSDAVSTTVGEVTYGINICFDSCFPTVMRDTALLEGVAVVLLPTLDPVAPHGTIQALHAAYTPFRAAELGVPIVRADTTAYSMVVDARGVIVSMASSGTEEVAVAEVTPSRRDTLYRRFGDWFLWVSGLVAAGGLVAGRATRRRARPSSLTLDP